MISDDDAKLLFQMGMASLSKFGDPSKPIGTQFYRGVRGHLWENQHPSGCTRHLAIFKKFNIIPKYCFNCYKVFFEPRTVIELFKLMMVFEKLELPNDNTRKCVVEGREQISGAYKGFIYCRSIEEGKEILKMVQKVVSKEISNKIPIALKRGCSEYPLAYPEYAQIEQDATTMEYKKEWQEYEDIADKTLVVNTQPPESETFNSKSYTVQDAGIMLSWLRYASTIGDLSYQKISGCILSPFPDLKRPSPFHPIDDK